MHLEKKNSRVLLRQLEDDLVHLLAWLCKVRPEVNERYPGKVGGEELLEMRGGDDLVVIGHADSSFYRIRWKSMNSFGRYRGPTRHPMIADRSHCCFMIIMLFPENRNNRFMARSIYFLFLALGTIQFRLSPLYSSVGIKGK